MDSVFCHSEEEKDEKMKDEEEKEELTESHFAVANIWKSLSGDDFFTQLHRRIL